MQIYNCINWLKSKNLTELGYIVNRKIYEQETKQLNCVILRLKQQLICFRELLKICLYLSWTI